MRVFLLILLLNTNVYLHAQNNEIGVVYYGHKESFGMGAPMGVDYNAILVFNGSSATYTFAKDSLEGGPKNEMKQFKNDNENLFLIQKTTSEKGKIFNINRITPLVKSRDVGFNFIKDSIPKINWQITNETKEIGSFECLKALCDFRGRNYTAWFSTSIPIPFGPWKLHGLPGLILEAYDTDKEIYFYFKSIEYPSNRTFTISSPEPESEDKEWISFDEYKKAMILRHQNGVKRGLLLSEQTTLSSDARKVPMKNVFLEVFE